MKIRAAIVQMAYRLNQSGAQFATFSQTRGNAMYWDVTPRGGLRLKREIKPSDAIRNIFDQGHLYGFECATAMIVIYYGALLKTLGPKRFNQAFPSLFLFSWHTNSNLPIYSQRAHDLIIGDVRYIDNPMVDPEHPEWQGENVVYMGNELYFGHGIGVKPLDQMIAIINTFQPSPDAPSAYLTDNVTRPNFHDLSQLEQKSTASSSQRIPQETFSYSKPLKESQSHFDYLIDHDIILIDVGTTTPLKK